MKLLNALKKLPREHKEAVLLLQAGTFLEYFDLMLFIHMAVILEGIFFETSSPLIAAFGFCATFVFRPLGALLFGWIGDNIGRKQTIVITTSLMCLSCIVMANAPTYAQVGILASWIVTLCRIAQGMSSMGEIVGAEIYLIETIERPLSYSVVTLISFTAAVGGTVALAVTTLITSCGFNWRYAFWVGALIAFVGAFARRRLRETPEFIKMKNSKMSNGVKYLNMKDDPIYGKILNNAWKEKINFKTLWSYFFISCGTPIVFYTAYIFFNPVLKERFGYSPEDIVHHNFYLSFFLMAAGLAWSILSYYIHPLKINKMRAKGCLAVFLVIPFVLPNISAPSHLFILQALILVCSLDESPGESVFLRHFPLYNRFMSATLIFALSRAIMNVIISFGLVYLSQWFGDFGIWILVLPVIFAIFISLGHFKELEIKQRSYPFLSKYSNQTIQKNRA